MLTGGTIWVLAHGRMGDAGGSTGGGSPWHLRGRQLELSGPSSITSFRDRIHQTPTQGMQQLTSWVGPKQVQTPKKLRNSVSETRERPVFQSSLCLADEARRPEEKPNARSLRLDLSPRSGGSTWASRFLWGQNARFLLRKPDCQVIWVFQRRRNPFT